MEQGHQACQNLNQPLATTLGLAWPQQREGGGRAGVEDQGRKVGALRASGDC